VARVSGTLTPQDELAAAASDLRYLLGRGYPRRRALELVGERYQLPEQRRRLLQRGACAPATARRRRARRLGAAELAGARVGIDGHNVLITLESALTGRTLLLADDGWLRDIAELGRHHRPGQQTRRAARLMLDYLAGAGAAGVELYLDAPLPQSGELAAWLREEIARRGLAGGAWAVPVPEKPLAAHNGPVAGSDSVLIDLVARPVDLAGLIITQLDPPPRVERLW